MTVEIINCEQNTEAWFRARLGIPTCSEFSTVLAKGKDGGASVTRKTYLYKLAGEIVTGEPMESYSNSFMERGKAMEDEARSLYSFLADADIQRVGFVKNGNKGYSPDSFVGTNGLLEIKTAAPHILIAHLLKGKFPAEHVAQCQGGLWVSEREWIDLSIYWPKMQPFTVRAYRDEAYIAELSRAVDQFNDELAEIVAKVRAYGREQRAAA